MPETVLVVGALAAFILVLWLGEWFRRKGPDRSRTARPEDYRDASDVAAFSDSPDID